MIHLIHAYWMYNSFFFSISFRSTETIKVNKSTLVKNVVSVYSGFEHKEKNYIFTVTLIRWKEYAFLDDLADILLRD